ncbi:helix-turn-helix transcriptional regulator [Litoribacter populi]|uniref:helix-turn-helix transcriptional regulator n=1 Tax=Litoribacter populi TaxID=2598460 RepID=UPI00117E054D|nr:helix-turn-helix transcriptional regulator [Litoribacter populi]
MQALEEGVFFGKTTNTQNLHGLTVTDTIYTHDRVDWHYHKNAYFTFILAGNLYEENKKDRNHCGAGSLLFHNSQDPHYNLKPPGFARGLHLEIEDNWYVRQAMDNQLSEGSFLVQNPAVKLEFYRMFREMQMVDDLFCQAIEEITLNIIGKLSAIKTYPLTLWPKQVLTYLYDTYQEPLSLKKLSDELNIHPVHLSRGFSKHFGMTLSDYVRRLRIEKSISLFPQQNLSLTEIAYACGFADQSHFNRWFKAFMHTTPAKYRALLSTC